MLLGSLAVVVQLPGQAYLPPHMCTFTGKELSEHRKGGIAWRTATLWLKSVWPRNFWPEHDEP